MVSRDLLKTVPTLSQAVLDAISEPVYLLNVVAGTLRPMNTAAASWIVFSRCGSDEVELNHVFPELNRETLRSQERGIVLTRINDPSGAGQREVILRMHAAMTDMDRGDETGPIVIVVRAVVPATGEKDCLPRDAFDDSFHDALTRLPNRRLFERRLERAIERGSHAGYHFAVLFVDLDGFKNMNDRFGHIEGDRLLVAAAHRMVEAVRPQDMVARRDGDEFTLLLDDLDHPDDAIGVADRIIQHLQLPLTTDDAAPLTISASIGIALGGAGTGFAQDLIARADAAMYRAKAAGGGRYVLAAPSGPDSDGGSPKQARQLPR